MARSRKLFPGLGSGVSLIATTANPRATPLGGVVVTTKSSRLERAGMSPSLHSTVARSSLIPVWFGPARQPLPSVTMPTPTGRRTSTRAASASPSSLATTTRAVRFPLASEIVRLRIWRKSHRPRGRGERDFLQIRSQTVSGAGGNLTARVVVASEISIGLGDRQAPDLEVGLPEGPLAGPPVQAREDGQNQGHEPAHFTLSLAEGGQSSVESAGRIA